MLCQFVCIVITFEIFFKYYYSICKYLFKYFYIYVLLSNFFMFNT